MTQQPERSSLSRLNTDVLQAQILQRLAIAIIEVLNDDSPFRDTINCVAKKLRDATGIEAVGIRLRNGEDFNYVAAEGFSEDFRASENSLLHIRTKNDSCAGDNSAPQLECTCGLVLSGHVAPGNPVFTEGGSCFLNHGQTSLASFESDGDPRISPRGRCFREGYQSIALVPVRTHQQIVGLLQLCDTRPGCFNRTMVEFFEGLSSSIGLALTRKQANDELKAKTERLNLALAAVGMGIWRWEVIQDKRYFDAQTCLLLGIDPATFSGTAAEFFGVVHGEDKPLVLEQLRRTLLGTGTYETDYRVVWKDGSIHHISSRGTCVRDSESRPTRIDGVIWDISERRHAEDALRRNEAIQGAIISNVSDVIAIVDRQGTNTFKSSNVEKLFGWSPKELVGKSAMEFLHPNDQPALMAHFARLLAEPGGTTHGECRYRCKDGTYKWIEVNAVNLLSDRYIEGILLNYHDITKRRRTQAALHESEALYRVLFERSRDALMTLAPPDWQFQDSNAAAAALFGVRDAAEFSALSPWQLSPERQPDGRTSDEKAKEMIETAMQHGTHAFEWTHRRIGGEEFPATVSLSRVELNGVYMLQATVRDESERRLMIARMAQSDRLASMGLLAAGVTHEINNPLAYVRYNIESLAEDIPRLVRTAQRVWSSIGPTHGDGHLAPSQEDDADLLQDASLNDITERLNESLEGLQRIVSITRTLSTFSRVEQVSRTKVDVGIAIESALNMAHAEISHRARVIRQFQKTVPGVWASEGKLSQVFLNLLVNAAQAIDEGAVAQNTITIRTWSEAATVFVEFTDTGKGIREENLERIFEPFFTTKQLGDGAGLGLSISKSILE